MDEDLAESIAAVYVDEVDSAPADGVADERFDQRSESAVRVGVLEQEPFDVSDVVVDGDLEIEDISIAGEEL